MMTTTTRTIDRLATLCDEVDATIRRLNDIRNGTIELDRPEDEDDLVDVAYDLWDEIEGIVNGTPALSDYERAVRHASEDYGLLQNAIETKDEVGVDSFRSAYLGQLGLIECLFVIDREDSHVTDHAKVWHRAKDTIEKLREELYHKH